MEDEKVAAGRGEGTRRREEEGRSTNESRLTSNVPSLLALFFAGKCRAHSTRRRPSSAPRDRRSNLSSTSDRNRGIVEHLLCVRLRSLCRRSRKVGHPLVREERNDRKRTPLSLSLYSLSVVLLHVARMEEKSWPIQR